MAAKKTATKTTKKAAAADAKGKKNDSAMASIEAALNSIKTKFGDEAIMTLGEAPKMNVESIPTGSLGLDFALGVGGLPKGRIVEIFGPESSGKTTLTLHVIAEAQKKGEIVAFIDAEHALDPVYASKLGVDINHLLVSQPETGEQALEIVESLVRTGNIGVIVVDSVAALTPKAEIEGDMGEQHVGRQARLMSHALRKLTSIVNKTNTIVIFINQIRMQIGVMFGNPETTPGGKALKFYTSVRLDIRKIAQIKKGEDVIGARTRVKVVKNKVAAPFKQAEFDLVHGEGISHESELLMFGEKYGIISKSGASYRYGDAMIGRGYDAARLALKENKELSGEIKGKIESAMKGDSGFNVTPTTDDLDEGDANEGED